MPLFKNFVEIGRVAYINKGRNYGKLCVIIDVVDHTRAYVDGPSTVTGVRRQIIPFRVLSLTKFKVKIPRGARLKTLKKAFEKGEIMKKWEATAWAKRDAIRAKRAKMTDFDRFKVMLARKKRAAVVLTKVRQLKREYNKKLKKPRNAIPHTMLNRAYN